jgi:membrane-associated protease RseP (regulator of RpoE activity)
MRRILLALALFAVGLHAAPAQEAGVKKDAKAPPQAKPVPVPFELLPSGHMAVQVKVNGKGPYRLIFDTGAPITLLNNKIAKEAGLLKGVTRPLFTLFGSMGEVKVKDLRVGDQKAEDVTAIVMDHPTVEAISKAFGPIDGIVGFPFFARFKLTLDYQAKTLTLIPNGFKPPDVLQAMMTALMGGGLGQQAEPTVLSPAAQWGMLVKKGDGDEESGVTVTDVLPGGAAAAAGLKPGDRLLTLDGRWTDTLADLYTAAGYVKPGATAPVAVKRDGKEVTLKVTPRSGM